jgi:hypothetical protein
MPRLLLLAAACASAAALALVASRTDAAPAPETAPAPRVALDEATGALVRTDLRAAAGARREARVAPSARGLRCPDGSFLPLLNGVDAAPPILRAPEHGPLPPVVAIRIDDAGFEWYEHADGSTTTCRPQRLVDRFGNGSIQVITLHNAGLPADGSISYRNER